MNTKVLLLVVVQSFDVKGDSRNKAQDNFDIHNLRVKKKWICAVTGHYKYTDSNQMSASTKTP